MFFVVGLGNPGKDYEHTRHNAGRMALAALQKARGFTEWTFDKKKNNALLAEGKVGGKKVLLVAPETFMNASGRAVARLRGVRMKIGANKKRQIENLAVIHDDLDIPFGSHKISWDKSSGGHKGVASVVRALKTQAFLRVRIGIASSAAAVRKSQSERAVERAILGRFTNAELAILKKLYARIADALAVWVAEGRETAMSKCNENQRVAVRRC